MKRMSLFILLGIIVILSGCATFGAATPSQEGEVRIVLTDYSFDPGTIRVKAGQKVTFVISNEGDKMHELMIGRRINIENDLTEGFQEDFFAGITPEIHGPGMVMGLEGGDMEHDMDSMAEDEQMGEMEQDMATMAEDEQVGEMEHDMDSMAEGEQMEGTEQDMETMAEGEQMGDMTGMEHDMEGMEHDMVATSFGALQRPLMDAHAGLMVMLDPRTIPSDQVTTITFTVSEDKVGQWELGCFQEQGQHYDDGMRGTLIVESAS